MKLEGKTALVLGAVKGIGREIGLALARRGVKVALTRLDWPESFDEMESCFAETGADYQIYDVDLLSCRRAGELPAKVVDRFGRLDILINNIERGGWPAVHGSYSERQWDLEVATTLRAKRWVFDAALPHLRADGGGVVVNFSSIAGVCGRSGPAAAVFNDGYSAACRGVSSLTETWARMGAPEVRVNEIMLGFFETRHGPGTRGWETVLTEAEKKAIINHTPAGRCGVLDEVVSGVLFLVRDATYMTGSVLRMDGGYLLGGEPVPPMPPGVVKE